jgi:two-component system OmpR family sensor kinase
VGRLFWKILLAFWLTLIATAAATGAVIWALREERAGAEASVALGMPALLATDLAAATLRHGGADALRDWIGEMRRPHAVAVFAVDAKGADILGRPVPEAALADARERAASGEGRPRLRGGAAVRTVEAPGGERYLVFAQGDARLRAGGGRRGQGFPGWLMLAMGAAASLAVSALLAWYLARPIRNLRWALRSAAEGRLETRVRPLMKGRRDEIADLGEEFDEMARRLQKLVEAQKRLLHDVSHELRSPLARLQAAIGLVRQDPLRSRAGLEASLERIEREAGRLDELVGEVLALARLEGAKPESGEEPVDLAELVAAVAQDARFEARAANREVSFRSASPLVVRGRPELLQRAVENVIRNAVKYTAEGSTVLVELAAAGQRARLRVTDRGPGVTPGDADRIFQPFYRSGANASVDGFGLGLAIAHAAIAAHRGAIRAENAEGGGLRVEIELPLAA